MTSVTADLTQPGLAPLPDRAALEISGADAGEFLHGQFISDIQGMAAGTAAFSAWCTPKGRSISHFIIAFDGQRYTLILPRALLPGFAHRLRLFVLRARLTITEKDQSTACLGLLNTHHADWPQYWRKAQQDGGLPIPPPITDKGQCTWQDGMLAMAYLDDSVLLLGNTEKVEAIRSALAGRVASYPAAQWALLEIQQRCPWLDAATTEAFIPQELCLDTFGSMRFDKGCYPGQEIIARIHYRGQIKRRLHRASSDAVRPIAAGSKIIDRAGSKAGAVVAAVRTDDQRQQLLCVISTAAQDEPLLIDGMQAAALSLLD